MFEIFIHKNCKICRHKESFHFELKIVIVFLSFSSSYCTIFVYYSYIQDKKIAGNAKLLNIAICEFLVFQLTVNFFVTVFD